MRQGREGQAVIEYVLMIFLAVLLVATINGSLNRSVRRLWVTIVRDVAAPCPKCPTVNPIR